ncbi:hypothetical protein OG298_02170 [Streptomyces sp. NBC_01005]|uniref:hypothetical protein n=1 Tax=unclassified Streptomyces TaxID=2593676 RepID=UPI002E32ADA3|nr:hypothetical protein [Streptomyces sp. NBC_01362]WSW03265.1 hypothetical protein OG298_02170 [Streptomyces sp. NBC_01005]WTC92766.1 hypothetical protein OH736_02155 [Streptomyces sp. NBC_01650]
MTAAYVGAALMRCGQGAGVDVGFGDVPEDDGGFASKDNGIPAPPRSGQGFGHESQRAGTDVGFGDVPGGGGGFVSKDSSILALPPATPEPTEEPPVLPAYQQILDVFADAAGPMRARDLCQALDLPLKPKNIESTRHRLKRLVSLGVLAETDPGLFIQRRP